MQEHRQVITVLLLFHKKQSSQPFLNTTDLGKAIISFDTVIVTQVGILLPMMQLVPCETNESPLLASSE